jgi:hypothetical protein
LQEIPIYPTRFVLIAAFSFASLTLTSVGTLTPTAQAQVVQPPVEQALLTPPVIAYSSSAVEAAPEPSPAAPLAGGGSFSDKGGATAEMSARPFSRVGIAVTAGTGGIGLQLATELSDHFNLRASGSYFSYNLNLTTDGYQVNGRILTRNANLSLDYFPFHNGFRISPGVTLDNGNAVHGTVLVPPGQSFDLGDGTYTSDPNMPVTGAVALSFGHKVAPSITVGWGNLVPRRKHLSIPVELGFEYIGAPLVSFNLTGNVCDAQNNCGPFDTDPTALADEQQQRNRINSDISPLRFFPIFSLGVGWSF